MQPAAFWIMLRKKGSKRFALHLARGGETRLKIHASQFTSEEADRVIADVTSGQNPDWEFRKTPVPAACNILPDKER